MHSEERFHEIEQKLLEESEEYDNSHPNGQLGRTLLTTAEVLARVQQKVHRNIYDEIDEQHQYQDIFFSKGVNALFALYRLVKHNQYDAAYREVRYLFESYLVIKGLNRDKNEAARILKRQKEEIQNIDADKGQVERVLHEYESVDDLHDILSDEKSKLKDMDPTYGKIYNFLSNRSTHPVRIEGASLDGDRSDVEETQLLKWGILLGFGLAQQFLVTYYETSAKDLIMKETEPTIEHIEAVIPEGVPTFLTDSY
ncbi:hypothetical protein [Haloarcula brevis]|uniref:hypothetical protein n=1 Tax=Haloarcula brevis TaxID=3111453 RepID=UPI00300E90B3